MRYLTLLLVFVLAGCLSLDDNLLSPGDGIDEYLLDDYTGTVDFRLDTSMRIRNFTFVDIESWHPFINEGPFTIKSIYLGDTARIKTDTVIVYCHGYNHHMDFYWPRASLLANVGGKSRFGVMMMDYAGYGLSEGSPTEYGMYSDVANVIRWLKSKGLTEDRLVMYGFSLGGMPAVDMTAWPRDFRPQWLITESIFGSPELLAQDATKLDIPGTFFTEVRGDNAEKIKQVDQPYLSLHGDSDEFIKFETHAVEIRNNYQGEHLDAVTVKGAGHEDLPEVMGFENYLRVIEQFLTR